MYSSDGVMVLCSGGAGGEQQRAGRLRDRGGAAGQGAAGEALSAEEDQTGGHDHSLPTGGQFKLHSPLSNSFNGTLRGDKVFHFNYIRTSALRLGAWSAAAGGRGGGCSDPSQGPPHIPGPGLQAGGQWQQVSLLGTLVTNRIQYKLTKW